MQVAAQSHRLHQQVNQVAFAEVVLQPFQPVVRPVATADGTILAPFVIRAALAHAGFRAVHASVFAPRALAEAVVHHYVVLARRLVVEPRQEVLHLEAVQRELPFAVEVDEGWAVPLDRLAQLGLHVLPDEWLQIAAGFFAFSRADG